MLAENHPYMKKALRLRRLVNYQKYNSKEQELFKLYMDNESNFEQVRPALIRLELEMQRERDISVWSSLYELISTNYEAAPLYSQTFEDRHWSQDSAKPN